MDLLTSLKISSSGMSAQRARMTAIASNLANINTTRTPEGGPYKRKDVIISSKPATDQFGQILKERVDEVVVVGIREDKSPPKMVYDPSHPDANDDGYVAMPNVNLMEEMVNLINTQRSYEANAAVISSTKAMAGRAIDLGSTR